MKLSQIYYSLPLISLFFIFCGAQPTAAQWQYLKNHPDVHQAFVPIIADVRKSTVQLESDTQHVALGAIIDPAGLIVSKSSELKGQIRCRLSDGKVYPAQVLVRDAKHDLALLHLENASAQHFVPIRWRKNKDPKVGSWLVTPGIGSEPLSIGIVSVHSRPIPHERGFLGVRLGQVERGPRIEVVFPGTAGHLAGLQRGDILIGLDGDLISDRRKFMNRLAAMMPAQEIKLQILRDQQEQEIHVRLGRMEGIDALETRFGIMNSMGGELSLRRADFPSAFAHDTVLTPAQCGGPVVDMDGQVAGINIARAGRTCSYALPAEVVRQLVERWKGKPEHQVFFQIPAESKQ
jgi:serine protease Do